MTRTPSPEEYWQRIMSRVPTLMGQLAHSSELRESLTGIYRHDGFTQLYGAEQTNEALASFHLKVFRDWVAMSLAEQRADLQLFLTEMPDKKRLVEYWRQAAAYQNLIPDGASRAERELFMVDLKALTELWNSEKTSVGEGN
jgi:hypothetical protein